MVTIYSLKDPKTSEIRYIGKTEMPLRRRLFYHIYENKKVKTNLHKKHWIDKLLSSGLRPEIEIVEEVKEGSDWRERERYFIQSFKDKGHRLLNVFEGGEGYTSDDVRKLWENPDYRNYHTQRVQGEKNPFYGRHHSEETKAILRTKCRRSGKTHPWFGRKHTQATIDKNRINQPALKTIARYDMNENFIDKWTGIKEMCRCLGLDDSAVIRVAKGRNISHKGFKFKYVISQPQG